MGNDFYHVKKIKNARRQNKCYWCNILTEHEKIMQVGVFEGDFGYSYFHPECYEALSKSLKGGNEYWPEEGSQTRGVHIE